MAPKPSTSDAARSLSVITPKMQQLMRRGDMDEQTIHILLRHGEDLLFALLRHRLERAVAEDDRVFIKKIDRLLRSIDRMTTSARAKNEDSAALSEIVSLIDTA